MSNSTLIIIPLEMHMQEGQVIGLFIFGYR